MKLLLDTQALVESAFSQTSDKLPRRAARTIEDGRNEIFLSAASIAELAMLAERQRLAVTQADVALALAKFRIRVLPLSAEHMFRLFQLPLHHREPFDRMIIATALVEDLHLVGGDKQFPKYKGLKVIWR